MRTLLSQFCEDFEGAVRPLLDPIKGSTEALASAKDAPIVEQVLPTFQDLSHQIRILVDKVAEQQAYVLIFGPLKSGKSTLMNAVAGSYVSEVTSLPAYPCKVFVSYSDFRNFQLTHYDGRTESFDDPTAVRMQLTRAHTELARRLREVEDREADSPSEPFDPAIHLPDAIRRVDVKVPANDLAQSGAVLVDTPGLYTRMKFGYDRMTREFRDTSACAIFVVKSENLFLEQVFEEFNQLLELFSRIFLVVNLDTGKKDLRPDGSLVPSLEHDDPIRIIEAFENLAMSAPLKKALDEGRLKIYPVDLLRAASDRLKPVPSPEAKRLEGQADFETLLRDLTDYLNSTDYLVAFLADSLRRCKGLLRETQDLCEHESLQELERRVEDLQREEARAKLSAEVIGRLDAHDWSHATESFLEGIVETTSSEVREIASKTRNALRGAFETWLASDASLLDLLELSLKPLYASFKKELEQSQRQALSDGSRGGTAGLDVPANVRNDLLAVDIRLDDIGRQALDAVSTHPLGETFAPEIDSSAVPASKGFWDWIFFRSRARVNKNLFGSPKLPTRRIPKAVKERRLGREARDYLWNLIEEHLDKTVARRLELNSSFLFREYTQNLRTGIEAEIRTAREANEKKLTDLALRIEEDARILAGVDAIRESLISCLREVDELAARYERTEPDMLIQPVRPPKTTLVGKPRIIAKPRESVATEAGPVELATKKKDDAAS